MVGIVIVSHSNKIAEGIFELAIQMTGENHSMVVAGGMDDGGIGTDAMMIKSAIIKANKGDGVIITVDLGSAVLSAETAIELLDEDILVRIADTPVVEGTIGAAVQASIGGSFDEVIEAAESARNILKLQ
ncbi:MAG: dihydroxyacetone kinase phosphoryl donor subunit DhaM [Vallitalea sp.]|jgi:dihydroxyacetone kinase phosphotransfer subunit|nr:dihydroxyacetone kinase phosphoryl donor subunit DhaM [Vallitalea sp.]